MTRDQIIELQERVGTIPDGFWGRESIKAARRHLKQLMPKDSPWPSPSQDELSRHYGPPSTNTFLNPSIIRIEAPSWLRLYDTEQKVKSIYCHAKVADSLLRALQAAYEQHPDVVRRYFGCHVARKMRGGTKPSTHAYGAAIDLAATTNANRSNWPLQSSMPIEVMEEFAKEGWVSAGAVWGRDAMHFQATK